ncbi:MAG: leucine-rich repeat domain-containing protein, partial [Flammeovirgaceae bacterium]
MTNIAIQQKIDSFSAKGIGYYDFICLAAQPLLFSSDLLYKLWVNFKSYKNNTAKEQASYLVVSDLILSSLCQPIGSDSYRMEERIRKYLQHHSSISDALRKEIAQFIEEYAFRNQSKLSKNVYDTHTIWAKGILDPQAMEADIIEKLQNQEKSDQQKVNYLSLYFKALNQSGSAQAAISLEVAENKTEEGVLNAVLPIHLRKKVKGSEKKQEKPQEILELEAQYDIELRRLAYVQIAHSRVQAAYVQDDESQEIIGLTLRNHKITNLNFLYKFKQLEKLYLGGNQISDITPIQSLKQLTNLGLNHNLVPEISLDFLNGLPKLEKLYVRGNPIQNIPKRVFEIEESALLRITRYLTEGQLEKKHLAQQLIAENLKTQNPTLDLGNCGLDGTEDALFKPLEGAEHVETLILSNAWHEFNGKRWMRKFSSNEGDANRFVQAPNYLPPSLTSLVMAGEPKNKWSIEDITPLERLRNLEFLDLGSNQIIDPSPIGNLSKLQQLYLDYNQIENISDLSFLNQLTQLDLNSNNIAYIPTTFLTVHTQLTYLGLRQNPIENIHREVFTSNNCLEQLEQYLSYPKAHQALYNFKEQPDDVLDLSHCDLKNPEADIPMLFEYADIQYLYLSNNQIQSIAPSLIAKLPNLQELYLDGNPIEGELNRFTWVKRNCLPALKLYFTINPYFEQLCTEFGVNVSQFNKTSELSKKLPLFHDWQTNFLAWDDKYLNDEEITTQETEGLIQSFFELYQDSLIRKWIDEQKFLSWDFNNDDHQTINAKRSYGNYDIQFTLKAVYAPFLDDQLKHAFKKIQTELDHSNEVLVPIVVLYTHQEGAIPNQHVYHTLGSAIVIQRVAEPTYEWQVRLMNKLHVIEEIFNNSVAPIAFTQYTLDFYRFQSTADEESQVVNQLNPNRYPNFAALHTAIHQARSFIHWLYGRRTTWFMDKPLHFVTAALGFVDEGFRNAYAFEEEIMEAIQDYPSHQNTSAYQLIEANLNMKSPYLDLGNCGLDGTEDDLFRRLEGTEHLQALILSNAWHEFNDKRWVAKSSANEGKRNRLVQVPNYLPSSLKFLIIAGEPKRKWSIEDITPLEHLTNLEFLDLGSNQLIDLAPLEGLSKLQKLYLDYNQIETISPLSALAELTQLDLNANQITQLPDSILTTYPKLSYLGLRRNRIEGIPNEVFEASNCLPELKAYFEQHHPQDTHPAQVLIEENLKTKEAYLDLGNCGLDGTEDEIFKLLEEATHINRLSCSNTWEEYSEEKGWQNFKSSNKGKPNIFKQIPTFLPPHVKRLVLAGEEQQYWSIQNLTNLSTLKQLEYLDLGRNQVRFIAVLATLENLNHLYIGYNQIERLQSTFKSLRLLEIKQNNIEFLTFDFNAFFPQLERLNLLYNPITNIPESVFNLNSDCLPRLKKYLQHAKAHEIIHNFKLEATEILDLRDCNIQDVEEDIPDLFECEGLQKLYLSNNQIKAFSPRTVTKLLSLHELYLEGNPIDGELSHFTSTKGNCLPALQLYFAITPYLEDLCSSFKLEFAGFTSQTFNTLGKHLIRFNDWLKQYEVWESDYFTLTDISHNRTTTLIQHFFTYYQYYSIQVLIQTESFLNWSFDFNTYNFIKSTRNYGETNIEFVITPLYVPDINQSLKAPYEQIWQNLQDQTKIYLPFVVLYTNEHSVVITDQNLHYTYGCRTTIQNATRSSSQWRQQFLWKNKLIGKLGNVDQIFSNLVEGNLEVFHQYTYNFLGFRANQNVVKGILNQLNLDLSPNYASLHATIYRARNFVNWLYERKPNVLLDSPLNYLTASLGFVDEKFRNAYEFEDEIWESLNGYTQELNQEEIQINEIANAEDII